MEAIIKVLPTCANSALQQVEVAKEKAQKSPQIAKLITRNFYMDDFVKSAPSAEQAIEIYKSLRAMTGKGRLSVEKMNQQLREDYGVY